MKIRWPRVDIVPKITTMPGDSHMHAQQQYVRLNDTKNQHIALGPHERP